jgi:hypothetical protein
MDNLNLYEIQELAQPEVKAAVRRFKAMTKEEQEEEILLYWLLGSGTPRYKMPKVTADYTEAVDLPEGDLQTCGNCKFAYKKVIADRYICSQVSGPIKRQAWCRLWDGG